MNIRQKRLIYLHRSALTECSLLSIPSIIFSLFSAIFNDQVNTFCIDFSDLNSSVNVVLVCCIWLPFHYMLVAFVCLFCRCNICILMEITYRLDTRSIQTPKLNASIWPKFQMCIDPFTLISENQNWLNDVHEIEFKI